MSEQHPLDPHGALRKKFREVITDPKMLWGIEVEPYDLLEKDTRLPLASINLANEEALIKECFGRFRVTLKGYDDDQRQPFDIPEVQGWFTQLSQDAPFFPYFLEPEMILVYAAATVPHTYDDGALRFERADIGNFLSRTQNALEAFCAQANVDATVAVDTLLDIFDAKPRAVLPIEVFRMPKAAQLFAFDLGAADELYGDGLWRRIDGTILGALQKLQQDGAKSLSVWGHLGEGFLGLFLADATPEQAELFSKILSVRFASVMSPPEEMAPTMQALPFWALQDGRLMRCAEDDEEDGPALLVASFDGEEWAFEAYEPDDELLQELLELTPGIEIVVARVIH